MDHLLSSYNYHLPEDRIAQSACEPREQAKVLHYVRATNEQQDLHVFDIPILLKKGDVLVLNNTKVFKARLYAKTKLGREHEVLLIPKQDQSWTVMCSKTRKLHVGNILFFQNDIQAVIHEINSNTGLIELAFSVSSEAIFALAEAYGAVPLPPYITNQSTDLPTYQTPFASVQGSVAVPTAGRHFTDQIISQLQKRGVQVVYLTLHIGIGTFLPVRTEDVNNHVMHEEWVSLDENTAHIIRTAKQQGRRIIAVGTTTTRALEGIALRYGDIPQSGYEGYVNLFIKPGFTFKIIDGLFTNFHLPKSTLLMLTSAFVGREKVLSLYEDAIKKEYRFYSLGDTMFIE